MKIAVFGSVVSTEVLLEKLYQNEFYDVHVWGYVPKDTRFISGWVDLQEISNRLGFEFTPFDRIKDCSFDLRLFSPDVLFVVGLSQIVPAEMLDIAAIGNVGFHPTALPKGRGRAAIAWLILEQQDGASTFFILNEGMDDGQILVQQPFKVNTGDNAATVAKKLLEAEMTALDRWLPILKKGIFKGIEQDHSQATWFGRRTPKDGIIDWHHTGSDIIRLIHATAAPHPGAFTYYNDIVIIIWDAVLDQKPEKGVIGRILQITDDNSFIVQSGDGLIRVTEWQASDDWQPRIGIKLGYTVEVELHQLRLRCVEMENRLAQLERIMLKR